MKKHVNPVSAKSVVSDPEDRETPANGTPSPIRHISSQKHEEIKRKVLTVHHGLLRRLAEHDRRR